MNFSSIIHLDTLVLIPIIDKKKVVASKDEVQSLSSFGYNLRKKNIKVKVSIVALGEIFSIALRKNVSVLIEELFSFASNLKKPFPTL